MQKILNTIKWNEGDFLFSPKSNLNPPPLYK
jgi:hypothetical protein